MKTKLTLIACLLLVGCTTEQLNTTQAIVDPIAVAMVSGYAQQYGVPPALTAAVLTPILNDGWGMVNQAQRGNPVAQGAAIPAIGATVQAINPTSAQLISAIGNLTLAKSNPAIANAILVAVNPVKTSAWDSHHSWWQFWKRR